jgi:hypothetical protein
VREDIAGVRRYADLRQLAHGFLDFFEHERLGFLSFSAA